MYKSILLPVDLEQESSWANAVPVAKALASISGATIHLITVVPDFVNTHIAPNFPPGFEDKARADSEARLAAFAADKLADMPHTVQMRAGTIYEQILEAAEKIGCDLIVIASHRPELADYLLGPNAARVVRHATCSVHVVRD